MAQFGEGHVFALAHLPLSLLYESAFLPSENVVGINQPLWLYEHTIVFLCERHKIPLVHLEFLQHFPRDDDLATLAYPPDGFPVVVVVLLAMVSDYLIVRNCQAHSRRLPPTNSKIPSCTAGCGICVSQPWQDFHPAGRF